MGFGLYCYPWDLVDEGIEAVYQRLRELGICRVHLATTYHRFQAILPHNPVRRTLAATDSLTYYRRREPTDPALLFESDSRWSADLAATMELARDYGIDVCGWTIALHYAPWFRQFPQYSVRNLYGEPFPNAVCPSNPEVQAFVKWLALDVADRLGVDEIELETPSWGRFFNPVEELHDRIGVSLGPLDELALSWCFCRVCTTTAQEAGIDVHYLVDALKSDLEATFASGSGRSGPLGQLFDERRGTAARAQAVRGTPESDRREPVGRRANRLPGAGFDDRVFATSDGDGSTGSATEHCPALGPGVHRRYQRDGEVGRKSRARQTIETGMASRAVALSQLRAFGRDIG